jgi:HK97 family phage prohead protease
LQEAVLEHKQVSVSSVRGIDDVDGIVEAIVSVTNIVDSVNDVIEPGAYKLTLKKRNPKVVWSHDTNIPVGKTLRVEELLPNDPRLPNDLIQQNAGALLVKMQFNLNTSRGRDAFFDVQFFGPEQEWSIGYAVPEGKYSVDSKTGIRYIKQLELFEYSPVIFGAAPSTRTLSLKEDGAEVESKAPGKYGDINFSIPAGVKKQAEIGLNWSKEFNRGGTEVGKASANYILNNSTVSPEKARHIARYFPRHAVDLKTPANSKPGAEGYPGAGLIAWKLWGGNEGWRWSQKLVDAMNSRDEMKAEPNGLKTGDFVTWRASGGRAYGRIERIVRDGEINVPDSSFTITGTPEDPAALIRVYRKEGLDYSPTEVRVGHKFSTLTKMDAPKKDVYTDMPSGTPGSFGTPQRIGTTPNKPEEKPYSIEQDVQGCNGYAVVKVGEGIVSGGCHLTLGEAQAHLAALNAAMQDEKNGYTESMPEPDLVPHQDDMIEGFAEQQDMGLNPRQFTMYDLFETMSEEFGMWDQGIGANGAHYMEDNPFAAEGMKCSNCVFFEGGKKCEIVSGNIEPEAICKLWIIREELLNTPTARTEETAGMKSAEIEEEVKDAGPNGRVIGTHETGVNMSRAWDKTTPYRNMKSPATPSYYNQIFAFQNPNTTGDRKTHYNFIHHYVSADGTPGEASYSALINSMAVLNGGRSGTVLRGEARRGVYNHIAAHYRDAGKEPPELKSDEFVDFIMIQKGIISKPLSPDSGIEVKAAGGPIPSHSTGVRDDETLDRSAILNTRSPEDPSYYKKIFAYHTPGTDGTRKTHYTFIHHHVSEDGRPGAAAYSELKSEMAILNGGRGGTILRGEDRKAVYNHLARHYRDFGKKPPELKSDEYIDNVMMQKGLISEPLSITEKKDEQD